MILDLIVEEYSEKGWPSKGQTTSDLKQYWRERKEFSICEDLLLYGMLIVVPRSLRKYTLERIHLGHQGIQRCWERALSSVLGPGISSQIYDMVQRCPTCSKKTILLKEPMIYSQLPEYPFQKIGTDLFKKKEITYLLAVDYFSLFPEVIKLTSTSVITALKSLFFRYGIPEEMVSKNGPQYISQEMKDFAKTYGFKHVTSHNC